jgi:hypothetical protein
MEVHFQQILLLTTKYKKHLITSFNLDKSNYNNDRQTGGDGFMILYLELLYRFTKRSNYIYNKGTIWRIIISKLSIPVQQKIIMMQLLIMPIKGKCIVLNMYRNTSQVFTR